MDVERSTAKIEAGSLSLTEARAIVRDLFVPDERIYWIDFLTTILVGYAAFALARLPFDLRLEPVSLRLILALAAFSVQCACFYRAVMFVHELVHLPERSFAAFRVAWNLLCGVPFLVPSFTYYTHLDHHRRQTFGTDRDGEYLPLASLSPWWIVVYLSQCLWVPPLAVIRFGVLTPLMRICPPLRRFIYEHASSLVMDPAYIRPTPTRASLSNIRLQELGCFLYLLACVAWPIIFLHRWPIPLAIQAYATGVALVLTNCLRTLASHRWSSEGKEVTFVEQMLDSVTMDNDSPLAVLLNPVGLRFHATHHLFPSMPYHNVRAAHKRLMARLPADSPYRRTVATSIGAVIADLCLRAYQRNRRATASPIVSESIGRNAAVSQVGRLRFSGFIGSLMWLFVHSLYLDQRQKRILVILQWMRTYVRGNLSARLNTGKDEMTFRESPEARWMAEEASRHRHDGQESLNSSSNGARPTSALR